MDPDFSRLDAHLEERGVDGYLIEADSTNADQYYLSGFDAPDPFVTLYDGVVRLLFARGLEYGRAVREARAETVERGTTYDYEENMANHGRHAGWHRTLAAFLEGHGVTSVATPPDFGLRTADGLRDQDIEVTPDQSSVLQEMRATKNEVEAENIRTAQAATEAAMARVEELLDEATADGAGILQHDDAVLTSERVKEEIEITLLRHGCALEDTIVACGENAADPHDRGSGPLYAGEAIVVDIFPRHKTNRYHADMTRTFCVGDPSATIQEWYDLTTEAKAAALARVEPGATGEEVHDAVCDIYEDAGITTLRSDPQAETGFLHSTGHGVGLEVHELPRISSDAGELEPGHVLTIEPGIYDPHIGGVRIEDLVLVTEDGYENLTDYEESLQV